jgi:amino acid transporter
MCVSHFITILPFPGENELTLLSRQLTVLAILFVSALVHWSRHGNSTLSLNWSTSQFPSASSTAKALLQGVCISFLGVTGIESTPDYVSSLRPDPKVYPTALRSLQIIAVAINAPLLLVVFAVLPMEEVLGNASVLSTLGTRAAGKWLAVLVTVDAVLILCATILAGS